MTTPTTDLSARGLLRASIALLREHPLPLLLPPLLLSLLAGGGNMGRRQDASTWVMDPAAFDPLAALPFYALVATIVTVVLLAIVLAFLIVGFLVVATGLVWTTTTRALMVHLETGATPDLTRAFQHVGPRWAKLGWTYFLACLAVLLGFIALIVPGFIVLAGFLPLFAVLATETATGAEALRRAWALTRGRKGQMALLVVGGVLLQIVVGATFGWIPFFGWIVSGATAGAVAAVWLTSGALLYRATAAVSAEGPVVRDAGTNDSTTTT